MVPESFFFSNFDREKAIEAELFLLNLRLFMYFYISEKIMSMFLHA